MNESNGQIKSAETTLTPELALAWREKNKHNRPLDDGLVAHYAAAIERGEWVLNGEPIIFDTNGDLLDGQHRIEAVIQTGKSIRVMVTRGMDPGTFDTINTGRVRSMADVLAIDHEKNYAQLASAVHWLWKYICEKCMATGGPARASRHQLRETLGLHPGLRDSVDFVISLRGLKSLWSLSQAATVHYLASRKDRAKADAFFTSLSTGESLTKDSPVLVLRERLRRIREAKAKPRSFVPLALAIKAYRAYATGRKVDKIQWDMEREDFPTID